MHRSAIETVIGALVLIVAAMFLYFTYKSGYQHVDGYRVTAKFNRIDGLALGSEVRLSGIKIGRVVAEKLDPDTYLAIVQLEHRARRQAARRHHGQDHLRQPARAATTSPSSPARMRS